MAELCKASDGGQVCNAIKVMQADSLARSESRKEIYARMSTLEKDKVTRADIDEIKETLKAIEIAGAERKGERTVSLLVGRGVLIVLVALVSWLAEHFFFTGGK